MTQNMTITEFLAQHLQGEHAEGLTVILSNIEQAIKKIAVTIDEGAIAGNMGSLISENVQGEVQKTLDVMTNDIFVEAVQASGYIAGMVSEEVIDPIKATAAASKGQYLLCFDPLDGSSNVNVNISVGTIFSV